MIRYLLAISFLIVVPVVIHDAHAADDLPFSSALTIEAITKACDAAASWQIAHPAKHHPLDWTHGALYSGIQAWGEASGNARWHDHLRTIGSKFSWKPWDKPGFADDHCVSQTWANLWIYDRIPEQLSASRDVMAAFIDKDPGNLDWKTHPAYRDWAWCDALFMGPPVLALLSTATGDKRWLDRMDNRWWHTSDFLFDTTEHLYCRDSGYFDKREKNGQKVFWSRGNGWVFAGLVHVLQHMPADYPSRPRYEEQFRLMAQRLVTLQTPDGTWHASLLDPEHWPMPETSGTAFFCYGFLWGISTGLLPADHYQAPAIKAWQRLVTHLKADGMLGYTQPIGASPAAAGPDTTDVYGVGGFLLAGTEMLNRTLREGSLGADVSVKNSLTSPRVREVTTLPWADAIKILPGITPKNIAIRDKQTSRFLPVQIDDTNNDGTPDELLFLATLAPLQERHYELLQLTGAQPPQLPSRLHARHVPERKDDFAWENDRMAFRLYGPALATEGSRGGIDVWNKRTREPVIDRWYKTDTYHVDIGEGCDCYKVGPTLGCGGTGYLDASGNLIVSPVYATHTLKSSGPLRLAFQLTYPPITIGSASITETRQITMNYGENLFQINAHFAVTGDATGITPVAGIRIDDTNTQCPPSKIASAWVSAEKGKSINGEIGEGLILPEGTTARIAHGHIVGVLAPNLDTSVTWHAGATWSKGLDYTTPQTWNERLTETAQRIASPLIAHINQ